MVDLKGDFQSVLLGLASFLPQHPGVVYEHIQARKPRAEVLCHLRYLLEALKIPAFVGVVCVMKLCDTCCMLCMFSMFGMLGMFDMFDMFDMFRYVVCCMLYMLFEVCMNTLYA